MLIALSGHFSMPAHMAGCEYLIDSSVLGESEFIFFHAVSTQNSYRMTGHIHVVVTIR